MNMTLASARNVPARHSAPVQACRRAASHLCEAKVGIEPWVPNSLSNCSITVAGQPKTTYIYIKCLPHLHCQRAGQTRQVAAAAVGPCLGSGKQTAFSSAQMGSDAPKAQLFGRANAPRLRGSGKTKGGEECRSLRRAWGSEAGQYIGKYRVFVSMHTT